MRKFSTRILRSPQGNEPHARFRHVVLRAIRSFTGYLLLGGCHWQVQCDQQEGHWQWEKDRQPQDSSSVIGRYRVTIISTSQNFGDCKITRPQNPDKISRQLESIATGLCKLTIAGKNALVFNDLDRLMLEKINVRILVARNLSHRWCSCIKLPKTETVRLPLAVSVSRWAIG